MDKYWMTREELAYFWMAFLAEESTDEAQLELAAELGNDWQT